MYPTDVPSTAEHTCKSTEKVIIAILFTMGQVVGSENLHLWGEVGGGMLSPLWNISEKRAYEHGEHQNRQINCESDHDLTFRVVNSIPIHAVHRI
jgi:hypothetical protein